MHQRPARNARDTTQHQRDVLLDRIPQKRDNLRTARTRQRHHKMAVLEPYEPCPRRPDGLHNLTVAHSVDSRHHLLHNRVCLSGIYPCQHTPVWRPRCRLSHHYGHNPVYRRRAAAVARHNRRIPRKSVQREQTPPALFCKHLQQPPDRFRTGLIPTPPHHRQ